MNSIKNDCSLKKKRRLTFTTEAEKAKVKEECSNESEFFAASQGNTNECDEEDSLSKNEDLNRGQNSNDKEQGIHPVDKLVPEILHIIFGFLSLQDLISTQYVCHKWQSAAQAEHLWNSVTFSLLNIPTGELELKLAQMPALKNIEGHTDNSIVNVIIKNVTKLRRMNCSFCPPLSMPQLKTLLRKYSKLESITLHAYSTDFSQYMKILQYCKHLKEAIFRICGHKLFLRNYKCLCNANYFVWFNVSVKRENFTVVKNLECTTLYEEIIKNEAPIQLLPNVLIKKNSTFVQFHMDFSEEKYKNVFNAISNKFSKLQELYLIILKSVS